MWMLGLSALLGNAFVILWRIKPQQQRTVRERNSIQSILVMNLAIADGFMGIYMLIIASADVYYRDIYSIYADQWKSSVPCKLAGVFSVLSSEASVFFLTIISVDRAYAIMLPFSMRKLGQKQLKIIIITTWTVNLLLSFLPIVPNPYFGNSYYGRSSVCLALPLTYETPPGYQYAIALLGLNLVAFVIMMVCYLGIFISVKMSSKSVNAVGKGRSKQIELATRMAFLIGTDLCCWAPIIIMGFVALSGVGFIPAEVYVWTAVFILPLNSSLNPYLYTILTREISKRKKKWPTTSFSRKQSDVIPSSSASTSHRLTATGRLIHPVLSKAL